MLKFAILSIWCILLSSSSFGLPTDLQNAESTVINFPTEQFEEVSIQIGEKIAQTNLPKISNHYYLYLDNPLMDNCTFYKSTVFESCMLCIVKSGRLEWANGNLAIFDAYGNPLWSINTPGSEFKLNFQEDGNLVIYDELQRRPVWTSHTGDNKGDKMVFQEDSNLVIYDVDNKPVWSSMTRSDVTTVLSIDEFDNE